jgi:hypothetical protein
MSPYAWIFLLVVFTICLVTTLYIWVDARAAANELYKFCGYCGSPMVQMEDEDSLYPTKLLLYRRCPNYMPKYSNIHDNVLRNIVDKPTPYNRKTGEYNG